MYADVRRASLPLGLWFQGKVAVNKPQLAKKSYSFAFSNCGPSSDSSASKVRHTKAEGGGKKKGCGFFHRQDEETVKKKKQKNKKAGTCL